MTPYYQDDLITLYNGRCEDILPEIMPSIAFPAIITDPPYGIGAAKLWSGGGREKKGSEDRAPRYSTTMEGNNEDYDPRWLLSYGCPTLLFGANHFSELLPAMSSWVVWDKRGSNHPGIQGLPSVDQSDCELAWTNFGGPARMITHQWMGIVRASERAEPRIHVTQKPVALMRWILSKFNTEKQTIIDPYAGSCSTLRAAKDLGWKSIGIEFEESMCEKVINTGRLEQETLPIELPKQREKYEPVSMLDGLMS